MKRRYTISGVEHLIRLMNEHPALLGLSSFAAIRQLGNQVKAAVAASRCSCSAGPIYANKKHIFDNALQNMQFGDHLIVKNALNVDEICFYTKDPAGKLTLKCV